MFPFKSNNVITKLRTGTEKMMIRWLLLLSDGLHHHWSTVEIFISGVQYGKSKLTELVPRYEFAKPAADESVQEFKKKTETRFASSSC